MTTEEELRRAATYATDDEPDEEALADADELAREILGAAGCEVEAPPEDPIISPPKSFDLESDDLLAEIDAARRATLSPSQRIVEELSADFSRSVQAGDVLGFFERTAARVLNRPSLNLKHSLVRKVLASADHLKASVDELKRKLEEASEGGEE